MFEFIKKLFGFGKKVEVSVGKNITEFKTDVKFDDNTGEVAIDTTPSIPYQKEYWLVSGNGDTPVMETIDDVTTTPVVIDDVTTKIVVPVGDKTIEEVKESIKEAFIENNTTPVDVKSEEKKPAKKKKYYASKPKKKVEDVKPVDVASKKPKTKKAEK